MNEERQKRNKHKDREAPPARLAYTYDETRFLLGDISQPVLWEIINAGDLRPVKGHRLISRVEIERYLKTESKRSSTARGRRKKRK